MKKIAICAALILVTACSKQTKNTQISGLVKGLKKGTLYLEQVQDTSIVVIDSFSVESEDIFLLEAELNEPEVLSIRLNKNAKNEDKVIFFAEPGIIDIQTTLKSFAFDAKINGGMIQEKYVEFRNYIQKFNDENLDLIERNFAALKSKSEDSVKAVEKRNTQFIKRKYRFATNFAVNNNDLELAPYIAISELYDANIWYLDTINNSLTNKVKTSKYGKSLQEFIDSIKKDSLY